MKNSQPKNAYKGGAEVFKGYVRLSSNENNYGPAKSVKSLILLTKILKGTNIIKATINFTIKSPNANVNQGISVP